MVQMFRPIPIEQEPKRNNRYVLEFPTELGIESYYVKTSGKPTITINSVEINYLNTVDYVAGKYKWGTCDIVFLDVIGPSTSQKVMEWIKLHAESETGRMGYAIGYKKNIVIKALDPTGVEVDKWTMIGCFITEGSFGEIDYSSDDISEVKITLQPSRCILNA